MWARLPQAWRGRLEPQVSQWRFYYLCAKWGIQWLWQDRYEMLGDFRAMVFDGVWSPDGPPPLSSENVRDELRPFGYAISIVSAFAIWDLCGRLAWGTAPPEEFLVMPMVDPA